MSPDQNIAWVQGGGYIRLSALLKKLVCYAFYLTASAYALDAAPSHPLPKECC